MARTERIQRQVTVIESFIEPGDGIKRAGVLFPVPALEGPDFTGTMGEAARKWVDELDKAGGLNWHLLPSAPPETTGGCPYSSSATNAGDLRQIDIPTLALNGMIPTEQMESYLGYVGKGVSNVEGVAKKHELLTNVFKQFDNDATPRERAEFRAWCEGQDSWLGPFAAFSALTAENDGKNWQRWSPAARDHPREAAEGVRSTLEYNATQLEQWLFHKQALDLKIKANQQNVGIIGDVPFYVGGSSVDPWWHPEIFSLDADGNPLLRAGVPPDCFAGDGQDWGNPTYRWVADPEKPENPENFKVLEALYRWWGERILRVLEYTNALRWDHARALANHYVIDPGKTAREARLVAGPGDDFLNHIEGILGQRKPFYAEDLGDIDDTVRGLIGRHMLGTSVSQFVPWWQDDASSNEHHPDQAHNRVAFTGTHDNLPVNAFAKGLKPHEAGRFNEYFGIGPNSDPATQVMKKIWESPAGLAIASIADVLSMGDEGRYNEPGTMHERNWSRRYPLPSKDRMEYLRKITLASGRSITS